MMVVRTIAELNQALAGRRGAFVPTMGALHAGHIALVRRACELARPVVVSIFVNPTQFAPHEDFSRYPRDLEKDVPIAASAGAEVIFAPDVETIYPRDGTVQTPPLPAVATQPGLEDAHRPGHFAGVCQVVARLFDLVNPSHAVFGEKDYQQLRVISDMVVQESKRWNGLAVVPHPTVREADGLAMSSRNVYLKPRERDQALGLWRALTAASSMRRESDADVPAMESAMQEVLRAHQLMVEYAVVRDAATFEASHDARRPMRALIAARLKSVRLIDNAAVGANS
jgi:pantoate--beta-alanine ligase